MSQPVFSLKLEEDTVQRVGTKLSLEVEVEESAEKVFFEWRGPAGSNADEGRVKITESASSSTAEISPLHLQVTLLTVLTVLSVLSGVYFLILRTRECGPARLKISMASHKQNVLFWPKVGSQTVTVNKSCQQHIFSS